ncbi:MULTISPECIES: ABC transporter ATP-binding protein [Gordonia]|uniref:ABC transporter ATP-binding protein n=2 Tax=Gordonia terrae TaxID=2055 RepID=A0AAD0K9K3_9ACTN|nr:ABC transporter ATP-binding protein [Gordonia terrae]VTR07858.1 nitrate/sulfonate/taurine/bicarbonate ABC transporter ATPase [Clostridioides difficile]ANY25018.1 ABC transporter ATP-binding protein [Gordonia terrae]AWO85769.1 ABC transporter ATP-binding protein [Gordonia terrae]VTS61312.1 Aliphatic sulfonates import ATP-binding protein SsuB [Gordonia terrae]GAB42405.1 putative ABC transporter ATP-binding protein [Gordonia terrae NBRC 100016]
MTTSASRIDDLSVDQPPRPDGIVLDAVTKYYGDKLILDAVDHVFEPGSFVSLIGPSGCGKSTLLRMIADLEPVSFGEVRIGSRTPAEARRDQTMSMVFQSPNLIPWRSVRRNVELPLEAMAMDRAQRRLLATAELERVGLGQYLDAHPRTLSGGMAQRAAIARALVSDPRIVLMDEPFGALDEILRERLNYELHALWASTGKTIVFVTHSIAEAVALSTDVVVMGRNPGRIHARLPVDLPRERTPELAQTTQFFEMTSEVRRLLASAS